MSSASSEEGSAASPANARTASSDASPRAANPASVERATDVVVFVYRASYYYRRTIPERSRHVEFLVEKNRFGPTWRPDARFDEEHWAIVPPRRAGGVGGSGAM